MNPNEKKALLRALTEDSLRTDVIIPLLNHMGFRYPREYHGAAERGKDILFYDVDRLGRQRFYAAVAKSADLTGDVSSNRSIREIVYQIEQCFNVPYHDLFNMAEVHVDHVYLLSSGIVRPAAEESIYGTLRKTNLDKMITIIDQTELIELLDRHYESYWSTANQSREGLVVQRDRIAKFMVELLERLKVDAKTIGQIKAQIEHSQYDISVIPSQSLWNISALGSVVSVDSISEEYCNAIYSDQCGTIREQFEETREAMRAAMWQVEEIIDNYKKLLKISDPNEYVMEFDALMKDEYPFHGGSWGRPGDALTQIGYLEDGLADINAFVEFAKTKGIYDWAIEMFSQVDKLGERVAETLRFGKADKYVFHLNIQDTPQKSVLSISEDTTPHTVFTLDMPAKVEWGRHTEEINTEKVLDTIRHELRKYIDKKHGFREYQNSKGRSGT